MSADAVSGPHDASGPGLRRGWSAIAYLIVAAVFLEAVLAGAMLSGAPWARNAHRLDAMALIAGCTVAGLAALWSLRSVARGLRLALTLLGLAVTLAAQAALGAATAHGANLLWLHIPLGVALVGLAMQATATARRLGEP